ncbi:MAG: hypothetical protein ACR2N8_02195 [Parvibaculales bacterium]
MTEDKHHKQIEALLKPLKQNVSKELKHAILAPQQLTPFGSRFRISMISAMAACLILGFFTPVFFTEQLFSPVPLEQVESQTLENDVWQIATNQNELWKEWQDE